MYVVLDLDAVRLIGASARAFGMSWHRWIWKP
jgi:hypothetical protein